MRGARPTFNQLVAAIVVAAGAVICGFALGMALPRAELTSAPPPGSEPHDDEPSDEPNDAPNAAPNPSPRTS